MCHCGCSVDPDLVRSGASTGGMGFLAIDICSYCTV